MGLQQDIDNLVEAICNIYYAGGPMHIVLDDCNVDTKSIKWCMENSIPEEQNIVVRICSEKLCELLLPLSLEQRIEYLKIDPDYELLNYLKSKEFGEDIMKDKQIEELTFTELKKSNCFSIIREHILQVSDGICAFYDRGKIRDYETGKETWISEDLLDILFPMFEKYAVTQMKRKGVYDLANEKEQLEEDINTSKQLKELVNKIDYNNKEQVEAFKDFLKNNYPNINKLWEI